MADNLVLNPSFEVDSNSDGLADNWTLSETVAGAVTLTRVAGLFGSYAQRVQYTGEATDANRYCRILSDLSAVGSVAEGDALYFSAWVKQNSGAVTYTCAPAVYTAADAYIAGAPLTSFTITSTDWVLLSFCWPSLPANSSRARMIIGVNAAIDNTDVVDYTVEGVTLYANLPVLGYSQYPVIGGAR